MSNTAILCFLRNQDSDKAFYSKFIRKIPRIGEQILIDDTWMGEVRRIEHHLYKKNLSHTIHIYLEA